MLAALQRWQACDAIEDDLAYDDAIKAAVIQRDMAIAAALA
jgi:hypothetical protein